MPKGKKSKYSVTKEKLQEIIDDLESHGTFPNRTRLYLAIERTSWAMDQQLKHFNISNFIRKFDIKLKTPAAHRGRPSKQELLKLAVVVESAMPSSEVNNTVISNDPNNLELEPSSEDEHIFKRKKNLHKYQSPTNERVRLRKLDEINEQQISTEYALALQANGKIVFYPSDTCPIGPVTLNNVQIWCSAVMNEGATQGLLYYPSVLFYWARESFPYHTDEYKKIRDMIAEYFVNRGLGKFVV
jgi:hypothetical protein